MKKTTEQTNFEASVEALKGEGVLLVVRLPKKLSESEVKAAKEKIAPAVRRLKKKMPFPALIVEHETQLDLLSETELAALGLVQKKEVDASLTQQQLLDRGLVKFAELKNWSAQDLAELGLQPLTTEG